MTKKKVIKQIFTLKNISIVLAVIIALAFVIVMWGPQIWAFFEDTERIKEFITSAGPLGPIAFVFLQIFQVVFAPIPGNVVGAVGGAAFDWWGLPLAILGSAIGMAIVVAISRKFGRPLLEKMFKEKDIKKLDWILDHPAAEMVLFIIFLLPFMPDDLIGYLAGLTKIRFRNIIIISILGRLPVQVVTNFFGANLLDGNIWVLVVILAVLGLLALLIYWKRKWFFGLLKAGNHREYLKNSITKKKVVKSKNVQKDNSK